MRRLQEARQNFFNANIQRAKSEPVFMARIIRALTEKLWKNLGQFSIFFINVLR